MEKIKRYKHMLNVIVYTYGYKKPKNKDIEKNIEKSIEGIGKVEAHTILNLIDRTYKGTK